MTEIDAELDRQAGLVVAALGPAAAGAPRRLVALAGPPGAGKSTLAERLAARLGAAGQLAAVMPMDGFHLDNRLLEPRGLLPRKGAPETFDGEGFVETVRRLRLSPSVLIPVFDRTRELAIAAAAEIAPDTRVVVVEGNYLLLDEDPWRALRPLWDLAVYLDVPQAELERRLVARWLAHGHDRAAAEAKARANDLVNAQRIAGAVLRPDLVLAG